MEKSSHLPKTNKRERQWNRALSRLGRGDVAPEGWGRERLAFGWEGGKTSVGGRLAGPMLHHRLGGTPLSISPPRRPVQKVKVVRGRAGREAQRAWEPAVGESFLEKDALLEWVAVVG